MRTDEIRWVRKIDPELDAHLRSLYRLTNDAAKQWAKAVDGYQDDLQRFVTIRDAQMAVQAGDPGSVVERIGWTEADGAFRAASTPILVGSLQRAAEAEVRRLKLGIRLDLTNPRVQEWAQTRSAALVTQISEETRKAIRTVIYEAYLNQEAPRQQAILIRDLIGLTERDAKAVARYWREVAMEGNRSAATANSMADTYARKLLRRRAELIGRTETINSANAGVQTVWREGASQGLIPDFAKREWIASVESSRTCEICLSLDGQRVGLEEPFYSSVSGEFYFAPTAHPACRCATALVTEI